MLLVVTSMLFAVPVAGANDQPPTPEQLQFFESKIRPLLVEKCQECHGAGKQQGSVRVDVRAGVFGGAGSDPLVTPGNPDASRLFQVLRHSPDDVSMPPSGKLPQDQLDLIAEWIRQGAPWPAETPGAGPTAGPNAQAHWAFQPPGALIAMDPQKWPSAPALVMQIRTAVDGPVLAKLESLGLPPAPAADRAVWLRRVTIDLTGVPPTFEEIQEFAASTAPDAHERVLDRLLASPLYGQRWGRYWLDIARYGDTKGYVFTSEPRYPYSYTYRDYVIEAFNADKPYNEFVLEQIAADQVPLKDPRDLAAMGFLTVGRRFLNNQVDIIDDRIDVVCRGLLGMTVGCARCHDHKFDPIPTADYYSLYGIFDSSIEPGDLPVIGEPMDRVASMQFQEELRKRQQAVQDFHAATTQTVMQDIRKNVGAYLLAVAKRHSPTKDAITLPQPEPRNSVVDRWERYLSQLAPLHPVFTPWQRLFNEPADRFVAVLDQYKAEIQTGGAAAAGNALVRERLQQQPVQSLTELSAVYGELFAAVEQKWIDYQNEHPQATALPAAAEEELRQILYAENSPTRLTIDQGQEAYYRNERDQVVALHRSIDELNVTSRGAPPRAMVLNDRPHPTEARIFIRGNPGRPGDVVPRQFLSAVAGPSRQPYKQGSGRLELAQSIVDPANPLTGRVLVNRIWQHHFGRGMVPTTSDFGVRTELPSHPAVMDGLARRLVETGWSIKAVHRMILASATYQQASFTPRHIAAKAQLADPENRALWQFPRQRLDLESWRDSLLAVSGRLDLTHGGHPDPELMGVASHRRAVYAMVDRNDLPGVFRAFDFADPDISSGERPQTTVPQQALFGLNSPFVLRQAEALVATIPTSLPVDQRVRAFYRQVLQREPDGRELKLGVEYLKAPPDSGSTPAVTYAQALLLTNEFAFID